MESSTIEQPIKAAGKNSLENSAHSATHNPDEEVSDQSMQDALSESVHSSDEIPIEDRMVINPNEDNLRLFKIEQDRAINLNIDIATAGYGFNALPSPQKKAATPEAKRQALRKTRTIRKMKQKASYFVSENEFQSKDEALKYNSFKE